MKWKALIFASLLWAVTAVAETETTYQVAHVRHRDTDMVFVVVGKGFFARSSATQEKWWTGLKVCAREAGLAGTTIAVAEVRGTFRFYGPRSWHKFLRTLDMDWVNARLNKELTCYY